MKIGICTFTDGRERVAESVRDICFNFQHRIAEWLRSEGHTVVEAGEILRDHATTIQESEELANSGCDAVIFNFSVWSFPDFTAQAALRIDAPILCMGNINPGYPGWVAFFASIGTLNEIGRPFGRALGDITDQVVQIEIRNFLTRHRPDVRSRGVEAAESLHGLRYGEFDGPSMGMYTGHIDQSQWMSQFGVHVHHRSQLTLAWMAEQIKPERVEAGLEWIKTNARAVHWDGKGLTDGPEGTLARQLRVYLAIKDLCRNEGVDFCGLTGQLDFTEWEKGCTMDLPEALLNDIGDWEDETKPVTICATECDSNGALTMELLHRLSGTPVLFADLRHYHQDLGIYDLTNSGEHTPWLAKRSTDPHENWKQVELFPAPAFYFKCGGACVKFFAAPAEKVTFARLTRMRGKYRMHILTGSFVDFGLGEDERLAKLTTFEWPHVYAKFNCSVRTLARNYSSNHIHAVVGDYVGELVAAGEHLDVEPIVLE